MAVCAGGCTNFVSMVIPQRILRVEYEFPPHVRVSRECKDLLKNILVPDPASRYTVEDIQRHPWYLKDLPPGVKEMNDNLPPPAPGLQASPRARRTRAADTSLLSCQDKPELEPCHAQR